ncbi:MAG: CRISPR-associated ring nuclease Csm6 [Candidatus Saccharicenans sp.]|nr:CRISPR-associated ring nuclease Csm6 [Candidatus Saccharicenans sp.]
MKTFKEVFIFVGGASPQIITETIYALATQKKPIYPDEIFIITTSLGKKIIKEMLLEQGKLKDLFNEYNIPPVAIEDSHFLVPRNSAGQEIDDIKTSEENESIAELITSFIREKTRDKKLRLHCSIAGGRKTMSFYLGTALQLFGRPWDKLYHVIVSPEFESHPDFFFKPKQNIKLTVKTPEGMTKTINTKDALIHLADLPFIRLGHKLRLKSPSFRELVAEGQTEIELSWLQPEIEVDPTKRSIKVDHYFFSLPPILFFIYYIFLKQKLTSCQQPKRNYCSECKDCYAELSVLFNQEKLISYKEDFLLINGQKEYRWQTFSSRWKSGISAEVIRQYISKINRQIENQVPDKSLNMLCKISSMRIYARSRYGLPVDKNKIILKET